MRKDHGQYHDYDNVTEHDYKKQECSAPYFFAQCFGKKSKKGGNEKWPEYNEGNWGAQFFGYKKFLPGLFIHNEYVSLFLLTEKNAYIVIL